MKEFQIHNGFIAADRSHASLIGIPKWLWLFVADHSQNVASCLAPLLHRHRRDSRQGLSRFMRKICEVANYLDFRMSGNGEVVVHNNPANMVNRYAERFSDEQRNVAGRPDYNETLN